MKDIERITFRNDFILIRQTTIFQRLLKDIVLLCIQRCSPRGICGIIYDGFQRRQLRYNAINCRTHVSFRRDSRISCRGFIGGFLNKHHVSSSESF